jgi:hypothetical protein
MVRSASIHGRAIARPLGQATARLLIFLDLALTNLDDTACPIAPASRTIYHLDVDRLASFGCNRPSPQPVKMIPMANLSQSMHDSLTKTE